MSDESSRSSTEDVGPTIADRESDRQVEPVDAEEPPRLPFLVVGIGASAGGLEAVTEFVKVMRADSGLAFVLVQHLPPDRDSLMDEILQRHTTMPVRQVEDGMAVEPDHFYVIRPGHTLTIADGAFHLGDPVSRPGNNRPVDDFFKSLAEEQRERGIGIILSGMGSNGTAGAQAIKAVGGLCVAQEPESAQFPSMPRHLIEAGYADYILRPADMPEVLLAYAGHPYARGGRETPAGRLLTRDHQQLREILAILRMRTNQDFNGYKKPTLLRRVERRMGLTRLTKMTEYAKLLRQSPTEVTALADDMLIHVTGFFRDPQAWEALRTQVVVPLFAARENDASIRCWVTACSSGEEAYSLAMLLVEEAERVSKSVDIKVFATDLAERSLQNARAGVFPGGIESEVSPTRLERFFLKEDELYRVRPDLRERVVFAPQNLLQDPPFSRLDIVSCRNLLIYLEPEIQQHVLTLLHFGLREGGYLFLGSSETTGGTIDDMFEAVDKKLRIFRRVGPTRHKSLDFPLPHALKSSAPREGGNPEPRPAGPRASMAVLTGRALLEAHTPPAVTVDRDNRITYYHGDTSPFIVAPRGEPTRDLLLLVRETVRGAVRMALHRSRSQNAAATAVDGWIETEPGRRQRISVTVSPLETKNVSEYHVVSFQARTEVIAEQPSPATAGRSDAAHELVRVRDELQSTIEELQTSNEELKASNEEVVSTNEELQSSNEELETSREEMQSLNEELTTVNAQLQVKMDEQQATSTDLASLLSSTDIAVLFLDTRFHIRRFTPQVRELLDIISTDIGRPFSDLARKFTDPELVADAEAVLSRLAPVEREISADADKWFLRRVTAYRTIDNRIDGVVIAFVDITGRRRAEQALRVSEERLRGFADNSADGLWIADRASGMIEYLSPSLTAMWGTRPEPQPGNLELWKSMVDPVDRDLVDAHLASIFAGEAHVMEYRIVRRSDGAARVIRDTGFPITDAVGKLKRIGGISRDITDERQNLSSLSESEERLRLLVEGARDMAMIMLDRAGRITLWNEGAARLLGFGEAEAIGLAFEIIFTAEDRAAGKPRQEIEQAATVGRAIDERWHVRKDGIRFWGSGVTAALRGPGNELRGFVKVLRDDTARKRSEEALQASKESAELANRVKDEFLATLSHELRTPLSSILIWSKLLAKMRDVPTQYVEGIDAITRSAESQKQLIDDLLDTSRITSGKLQLAPRPIAIVSMVQEAIDAIRLTADAKEIELVTEFGADVGIVRADPDRIRQVVWNLLSNAVKFTPEGGRVEVGVWRRGRGIEIRVTDTGRGIDPEFLPHIFEPFRQADSSTTRPYAGLGLGLAICKKLVEHHGGTITAASDGADAGATFTVRLPLAKLRSPGTKPERTGTVDGPAAASSSALSGKHILLVEDEPETRVALATLLRFAGASVTAVDAVTSALEAREQLPHLDLLVSDIGMVGQDGYSLIRRIRELEQRGNQPRLPAVALTAFAREEDRDRALAAGFDQHIGKPVDPELLLAALTMLIAGE